ncbi:MAG: NAD(P)H-dependent oxidoreductase [Paludibacter sp.]
MKKILIINGNPEKNSYNYALSQSYSEGAKNSKAEISTINISELQFNPNLAHGYQKRTELEPDLQDAIEKIKNTDHIVWFFPMWWYSCPAIMKGFIDRTFLPGITFQPVEGRPLPEKLLKGKSARLIITADSPSWFNKLFMKSPAINQIKRGTLQFCGVNPVKITYIAPMANSTEEFREKHLQKVYALGEKLE